MQKHYGSWYCVKLYFITSYDPDFLRSNCCTRNIYPLTRNTIMY